MVATPSHPPLGAALALAALLCLPGAGAWGVPAKHEAPIPAETLALMTARNTDAAAPVLMRVFKKEAELEVWKRARSGRFVHLKTFPICRWSGQLGPKQKEGDRQTPEGFYAITPRLMNPNSAYYLSFDTGFPNAYDRAHKASGSALMVHGTCSSRGCFAMTDEGIAEIYALAREAFAGGQAAFQFQSLPFRMTAQAMARHRADPSIEFWRQLKEGSDRFEATGEEPVVDIREARYAFRPLRDPAREALAQARVTEQKARIEALVADGIAGVRTTYSDGGQHAVFAALMRQGVSLGNVSRPEALALAGREIVVIPMRPKPAVVAVVGPVPLIEAAPRSDGLAAPGEVASARPAEPSVFAWSALDRASAPNGAALIRGGVAIVATAFRSRTGALAMQ